jgi:signal transduction histidine kinase
MAAANNAPERGLADATDHLRHDLLTPLTTISGRTQLLARAIGRSPTLAAEERVTMLEGITAIETAVQTLRGVIASIGDGDQRA